MFGYIITKDQPEDTNPSMVGLTVKKNTITIYETPQADSAKASEQKRMFGVCAKKYVNAMEKNGNKIHPIFSNDPQHEFLHSKDLHEDEVMHWHLNHHDKDTITDEDLGYLLKEFKDCEREKFQKEGKTFYSANARRDILKNISSGRKILCQSPISIVTILIIWIQLMNPSNRLIFLFE